ncbi:hypothetical protein ACRALDRAFT_1061264 [Sodiomyces alcalophilus JCM 7366]|uniref:uncharacterized protein n=1 Tax=Sodiomyces alcalophilus JCM 7366 TaxID=591952 RepID=UPI0039B4E597
MHSRLDAMRPRSRLNNACPQQLVEMLKRVPWWVVKGVDSSNQVRNPSALIPA